MYACVNNDAGEQGRKTGDSGKFGLEIFFPI